MVVCHIAAGKIQSFSVILLMSYIAVLTKCKFLLMSAALDSQPSTITCHCWNVSDFASINNGKCPVIKLSTSVAYTPPCIGVELKNIGRGQIYMVVQNQKC